MARPPRMRPEEVTRNNFREAPEITLRQFLVKNGVSAQSFETLQALQDEVEKVLSKQLLAEQNKPIERPDIDYEELEKLEGEDLTNLIAQHLAKLSREDQLAKLKREVNQLPLDPYANTKVRIKVAALRPDLVGNVLQFAVNGKTCLIAAGNPDWVPVSKMFITGSMQNAIERGFDLVRNGEGHSERRYHETPQYNYRIHPADLKYFPEYEEQEIL